MKTIVTHESPDLDAVTSAWMIHRFLPGWKKAHFEFVPAGQTLNSKLPDAHPDIIHVDTGFGKFDHHQSNERTCASMKVYQYLEDKNVIKPADATALYRIAEVVNRYDHFQEVFLNDPDDDIYDFSLAYIVVGLRLKLQENLLVLQASETALDALFINFKNKTNAEHTIQSGYVFTSWWGRSLAFESENDAAMKLSFKKDYDLTIRKSTLYDYVRIKLHPGSKKTLKKLEKLIKKQDPSSTWFYHPSGKMLLNGSSKKSDSVATKLTLNQVIGLVKQV